MNRLTRHRVVRLSFVMIALQVFASSVLHCQNSYDIGGLAGAPMRMGFGARGMAMANALSAIADGNGAGYYNPALVPFQVHPTALASFGFLPLDRNLNFVSYTQSLKPTGGFSLAVINSGVSKIEGRDQDGIQTETYSTSENEFLFTFGTKLQQNFAIGVSAKILYYSLFTGVKSTTVGFDLGALYIPSDDWSVALVISDINSKYKWDTSSLYGTSGNTTIDRFPLRRKAAVCWSPQFMNARIAGEVEWIGTVVITRAGAEVPLQENFAIRGGVDQIDFGARITAKPSIGFSLKTSAGSWKPILDYGYVLEPYTSGGIHMLSLSVSFE